MLEGDTSQSRVNMLRKYCGGLAGNSGSGMPNEHAFSLNAVSSSGSSKAFPLKSLELFEGIWKVCACILFVLVYA